MPGTEKRDRLVLPSDIVRSYRPKGRGLDIFSPTAIR
jgi:hypothetical protein